MHVYSNRFVDRIALYFYFGRLKVSKHKKMFKIWPKIGLIFSFWIKWESSYLKLLYAFKTKKLPHINENLYNLNT